MGGAGAAPGHRRPDRRLAPGSFTRVSVPGMPELHEILAERVAGWRGTAYAHDTQPAIAEILLYARNEDGSPRYLREPQIRALETYWYLRLVEGTRRALTSSTPA